MSATVFEMKGNVLTAKPSGRLDANNAPVLEKELQQHLSDDVMQVIMDFALVDYIASAGMRVLLATDQKMEERGGSMKLVQVKKEVLEILEMVGFLDIIDVEEA